MKKKPFDWLDTDCPQCGYTRQMLEQSVSPIFVVDPEGTFLFINDACLKMIGSPGREHSMEYNIFSLPTAKAVGIDKMMRRCLDGERVESEFQYLSMWGKPATGQLVCIPLREANNQVVAAGAMVSLETTQPRTDEVEDLSKELETAHMEMRQLDHLRKRFMAIVSHELRTPLAPLLGYLQMLQEQKLGPLTEMQQKAIDVAARNTERLIDQVEKILAVTSEQGANKPRRLKALDTRALVEEAAESMESLAQQRDLVLEVECADDTPQVAGEQERLSRVLMTLLDNALKFAGPSGRVLLTAGPAEGDGVAIEVANTGQAIPEEERARVFEPFYQVEHPHTRSHGGIGLGLAIVRETVLSHGGSVNVVQREGYDTAIRVVLPSPGASRSVGFRVLLVDQDDRRRQALAGQLAEQGYEVNQLDAHVDMRVAMTTHSPTAIVMSIDDPSAMGMDLLETLRAGGEGHLLPIFTITADSDPAHRRAALDAGATAVLPEPLDTDWLLRLLDAVYPTYC